MNLGPNDAGYRPGQLLPPPAAVNIYTGGGNPTFSTASWNLVTNGATSLSLAYTLPCDVMQIEVVLQVNMQTDTSNARTNLRIYNTGGGSTWSSRLDICPASGGSPRWQPLTIVLFVPGPVAEGTALVFEGQIYVYSGVTTIAESQYQTWMAASAWAL